MGLQDAYQKRQAKKLGWSVIVRGASAIMHFALTERPAVVANGVPAHRPHCDGCLERSPNILLKNRFSAK